MVMKFTASRLIKRLGFRNILIGNAVISGAFLASYRRSGDLRHAATTAASAAATVLGAFGVPPPRRR